jgi:hypothetical protein
VGRVLPSMAVFVLCGACAYTTGTGPDCMGPTLSADVSSLVRYWRPGGKFTICADEACNALAYPSSTVADTPERVLTIHAPLKGPRLSPHVVTVTVSLNGVQRFAARTTQRFRASNSDAACAHDSVFIRVDSAGRLEPSKP